MSTSLAFDIIARDRASATFNKVSRSADGTSSKFAKFGRLAKVGATGALAMGAGLAVIGKSAVSLEREFSKTMNVLQATTKASSSDMTKLTDLAMKMGAETVFSANDASKAMLELARGGMSAAQIKAGALAGTLTLAAAGELEMGEAANIAVKSMGQFGLKSKDMGAVAAALAGGANASSASVRDMSIALAQGGLAANSVGFSLQETTAVLAAFSNAGLESSDAGTSMKTMLDRLQPATDKQSAAMKQLGAMTKDGRNLFVKANGEFKSAAQIAEILKQGTEKLSQAERKRLITQAFGSDAQRAATIFANEGAAGLNRLLKATSDQSAAEKMAAANMKGTAGALERLSGSIETAQLQLGRALAPAIVTVANALSEKVIPGAVKAAASFKTNLGPTVAELARTWWRGAQMMGHFYMMIAQKVAPTVRQLGAWIKTDLMPPLRELGNAVLVGVTKAMRNARGSGEDLKPTIKGLGVVVKLLGAYLVNFVIPAYTKFATHVLPKVGTAARIAASSIGAFTTTVTASSRVVRAAFNAMLGPINKVATTISGLRGKIVSAVGNLRGLLYNAGREVISGLIDGVQSKVGELIGALGKITSLIPKNKGPIAKDRILLKPSGVAIMDGLISGIESRKTKLTTALSRITAFIGRTNDKIKGLISKRNDIAGSFGGFTSSVFGQDMSNPDTGAPGSVGDMIAYQKAQAAKAAQLKADVQRLTKMGLSKSLILQLASSGESGMSQIHTLAGGSTSDVKQLNALNAATNSSLAAAGMTAGNAVYGEQIADERQAKRLAEAIERAFERLLKRQQKNTVYELHMDGRRVYTTLREIRRKEGPLGLN